jgi:transcriptional regulator with XRE-family HTH domain
MNINIAGNLKRLRKQREITQEDLANFIGVSFQAVSKWECGDGYPDITILPVLANFFDVTLDELVGMNEIKNQAKLEDILRKVYDLASEKANKTVEIVELLRGALKIFPDNYQLLAELATFLHVYPAQTKEEKDKNYNEAIKISERILEFCTDAKIRNAVQSNLCHTLWSRSNKEQSTEIREKAVELAEKLPTLHQTRDFSLNKFLHFDRDRQIEECQKSIQMLAWGFWWQIELLAMRWKHPDVDEVEHYTAEEVIKMYQKAIDIYNIIYDEENDFAFSHCRIQQNYEYIAQVYIKIGRVEESIINLEKAADHAIAFTAQPDHQHKSLLVNKMSYKAASPDRAVENNASDLKSWIETSGAYDSVLTDKRVQKILNKLGEYAE